MEENKPKNWEDEDEINLLDLLIVLAKHKKLIMGVTLGAAVIMAAISLTMAPIFTAETKIFVPQSAPSISTQLLNQLGPIVGLTSASKTPSDLYIELLKSRPVRDRIIDRFDLMKLYKSRTRQQAQKTLLGHMKPKKDAKSDVITLGVEDKDPLRAALMANAFIEEFQDLNKALALTEASRRRLFFEDQLKDAKVSLSKAEDAMKAFQERTGAVKIEAQATAVIEGIGQLQAQIAAKEIQIKVMRTYSTSQNPDVLRAEEELRGMREQVGRLESKSSSDSVMVPTGNIPSASTEYMRRMRDLKFNETLYELLLGQYQSAKLDEARDALLVQVIEKAVPPERKTKPKRSIMVLWAMITGLIVSSCTAFVLEYKENASRNPETLERMDALKRHMSFRRKPKGDME